MNTHGHTYTHITPTPPSQGCTQNTPTFNRPVGMCFSRSFEAEIFELHGFSYEVLPRGSAELQRPSDNSSQFPEFSAGQKHPLLFQIVMRHRKQKMVGQINSLRHIVWQGMESYYPVVNCLAFVAVGGYQFDEVCVFRRFCCCFSL